MEDIKTQRKTLQDTNMDFWNYIKNTIKPDLEAIRLSLKVTPTL
jgi:hypothetical protein